MRNGIYFDYFMATSMLRFAHWHCLKAYHNPSSIVRIQKNYKLQSLFLNRQSNSGGQVEAIQEGVGKGGTSGLVQQCSPDRQPPIQILPVHPTHARGSEMIIVFSPM